MKKRFCIVTTQRTGSTWLVTLLDSHPEIRVVNEPFLPKVDGPWWREKELPSFSRYREERNGMRPFVTLRYLDLMTFPDHPEFACTGFKIMYNQLLRAPEVLFGLLKKRYALIHLVRRNALDIYLSGETVRARRRFHSSEPVAEAVGLHVDPRAMLRSVARIERKLALARILLALLPLRRIEIDYRDLTSGYAETTARLLRFLGVENVEASLASPLHKLGVGSYRERISNYDEVFSAVAGTKRSWMLDE